MTRFPRSSRWLLAAALVAGAAAAQAAPGVGVNTAQETQVHAGMTRDEVRQALGRPERVFHFANETGPTWTYVAPQEMGGSHVQFDVDFGHDGRVVSASERIEDND